MSKPRGETHPLGKPRYYDFFCAKRNCKQHIALCETGSSATLVGMYLDEKIFNSREWLLFLGIPSRNQMPNLRCPNPECGSLIGRPMPLSGRKFAVRLIRNSFVKEANRGIFGSSSMNSLFKRRVQVICGLNKAAESYFV